MVLSGICPTCHGDKTIRVDEKGKWIPVDLTVLGIKPEDLKQVKCSKCNGTGFVVITQDFTDYRLGITKGC